MSALAGKHGFAQQQLLLLLSATITRASPHFSARSPIDLRRPS